MGTGLIYAAIVLAWAVYLVPLWLRRHDEATAARSVQRFSTAMRVLARRPVQSGPDHTGADQIAEQVVAEPGRRTGPVSAGAAGGPGRPGGAGRSAAARRRRTLLVLIVGLTAVAGLAGWGRLAWGSVAVPAGLLVLFLLASSRAARREREWSQLRRVAEGRPVRAPDHRDQLPAVATEPDGAADVEEAAAARTAASPAAGPGDAASRPVGTWDPVSVPLPTYMGKARATRSVRTVDLSASDVWSSGRRTEPAAAGQSGAREDGAAQVGHREAPAESGQDAVLEELRAERPAVGD